MVIVMDENRVTVHVDPDVPDAWKTTPYYADLKHWARYAAEHNGQLVVSIGQNTIAVLPDSDVDLGFVDEDEIVFTGRRADGSYGARKFKLDDPELRGIQQGRPYIFDRRH
jgi:hypothetical protein